VGTYLDRILAAHRAAAAVDTRPLDHLAEQASACPPARPFREALVDAAAADGIAVIAEVKRRSPSRGDLAPDLDPARLAKTYEAAGAACLSVVTDAEFFGGSADDLTAARAACTVPVLRKDFTVGERDVIDARLMGADAVLLIAATLDDGELGRLAALGRELGLAVLVEVHDEPDLDRAMRAGADLVGVNQRDLVTFEVDHDRAARMAPLMPAGVVRVAESGVRAGADVARLAAAGYHAVLVGESLVTAADPGAALEGLRQGVR
jgi:indole-3-glycerol phosphate synthase